MAKGSRGGKRADGDPTINRLEKSLAREAKDLGKLDRELKKVQTQINKNSFVIDTASIGDMNKDLGDMMVKYQNERLDNLTRGRDLTEYQKMMLPRATDIPIPEKLYNDWSRQLDRQYKSAQNKAVKNELNKRGLTSKDVLTIPDGFNRRFVKVSDKGKVESLINKKIGLTSSIQNKKSSIDSYKQSIAEMKKYAKKKMSPI